LSASRLKTMGSLLFLTHLPRSTHAADGVATLYRLH
jgi:hypothetical protein